MDFTFRPETPGGPPPPHQPFGSHRPPERRRGPVVVMLLVALVAVGAAIYFLTRTPPAPAPVAAAVDAGPEDAGQAVSLDGSDETVRQKAHGLAYAPEWQQWLGQQDLLRRFATAVRNVAQGESPRTPLAFLAPKGTFQVKPGRRGQPATLDPENYRHYSSVGRVIKSIDVQLAAGVLRELMPLVDAAYAEVAPPGERFGDGLRRALGHLTEVELPPGPVPVVPKGALWAFQDPKLESLSAAQKHLVRMGPENGRIIQEQARAFARAMGLTGEGAGAAADAGPLDTADDGGTSRDAGDDEG